MNCERTCPAPGCGKAIAETSFSCLHHWKALPRGLRLRINKPPTGQTQQDQARKAQRVWAEQADPKAPSGPPRSHA